MTVIKDLSFESYLARRAVSKSSLWTLHTRSPAHARVEKEESNAMKMGTAVHCAVLEPDVFEERFVRGPDDRRGNKWKEALDEHGARLLTSGDYDDALAVRDVLMRDPVIRRLTGAGVVREASAFWTDEETGLECRIRPDAYDPKRALMADLKMTTDARGEKWRQRVEDFGYHLQEPWYSDGWPLAGGGEVAAFCFIVVEDKPPFEFNIFELEPAAAEEGRAIGRAALRRWAECRSTDRWPGYERGVKALDLRPWAYQLTERPLAAE